MKNAPYYLLWLLTLALLASACETTDDVTDTTDDNTSETVEQAIIRLTNEHRTSKGLSVLTADQTIGQYAKAHTQYMIAQGEISHDTFSERMSALKAELGWGSGFGENVAYGYSSADAVMTGWLNSQGHRENIEGNFTHIGVSAIQDDGGTYYYTQIFIKK